MLPPPHDAPIRNLTGVEDSRTITTTLVDYSHTPFIFRDNDNEKKGLKNTFNSTFPAPSAFAQLIM